mgnify:CR=1 FL=1
MDRIHRPKMAWKMIGLIAILNLAGIVLMYLIRTSILADAGNNPGDVEWIASGIGGNINYLKSVMWTIIGLACMIGICYFDYSRIGKYGKLLTGGWIVVMGLSLFMGAVYINGAAYGILFYLAGYYRCVHFLYLIVPAYAATLYSMRRKKIWLFRCCKGNTVADTAGVDHLTHSESVHGNQRRSLHFMILLSICSLERMV